MKITDVQCLPLWGGFNRNYTFVLVETDEGVRGIGEAGLTGREQAVCGAIEHFRSQLVGQDPARIGHLWQMLSRGAFFPAQRVLGSALAAVDIALHDIQGQRLGVPVYQLLGGKMRNEVACYTHAAGDNSDDDDLVVRSCLQLRDAGWPAVRIAVPTPSETFDPRVAARATVRRVSAIRVAIGPDTDIIVDVHTRLELPDAVWLCRELEPLRPLFVEDPLRCENLETYERLRQLTGVALAAGEQLASKWEFRPLIERNLIDFARVDLCVAGGLTEAQKIAALCETHGVQISVHNPLGPVSTAAAAHFNLACAVFGIQEVPPRHGAILPDVFSPQPRPGEHTLIPSERPGLGLDFNVEAADEHPPKWVEPPHLARTDGGFTNW